MELVEKKVNVWIMSAKYFDEEIDLWEEYIKEENKRAYIGWGIYFKSKK